jgi:plastocyanin
MTSSAPQVQWSRRRALLAGGLLLAGWALSKNSRAAERLVEVRLQSDTLGTTVGFDPIGLHVPPGTTVRWVVEANVHTVTAYHPRNDKHSLRIPPMAEPFDSGFLINPGNAFELRLTHEGVYDYFCLPHEGAGMVGRIIVGRPGGPGLLPFDYFKTLPEGKDWKDVPPAAQAVFPSVAAILRDGTVRRIPPKPSADGSPDMHTRATHGHAHRTGTEHRAWPGVTPATSRVAGAACQPAARSA